MDYTTVLEKVEGIDRVEGPFSLTDPSTGAAMSAAQVAQLYAAPAGSLPPQLSAAVPSSATPTSADAVRLDAISPLEPAQPEATAVVLTRSRGRGAGRHREDPGRRRRGDRR